MSSVWRISCVAVPLVLTACGYEEPAPPLKSMTPDRAYSDNPVPITLAGGPFRPGLMIDTASGSVAVGGGTFTVTLVGPDVAVPATSVLWSSANEILATVPAGIPAGRYDVDLRDPRGHTVALTHGYTSLGTDRDPPVVTIDEPPAGARTSPYLSVSVRIGADDGLGHLQRIEASASSSSLGTFPANCPAIDDGPRQGSCSFAFMAPAAPTTTETITIKATATDVNGNQGTASRTIDVVWVPVLTSVSPTVASTSGLTPIQIKGSNFLTGVSQILIDGQPILPAGDGDGVVSDREIDGITLAHPPGIVAVTVANGPGRGTPLTFEFVAPPRLKFIDPTSGPESTPTAVTLVGDHFRQAATAVAIIDGDGIRRQLSADDTHFISSFVISARLPPGHGTISVIVVDPVSGESVLPGAFSYFADPPLPGGGSPQ
jgi:hypothetical protein